MIGGLLRGVGKVVEESAAAVVRAPVELPIRIVDGAVRGVTKGVEQTVEAVGEILDGEGRRR